MLIPAISLAVLALQAVLVVAMGHPAMCTCGYVSLWQGSVASAETSQHLTDWYTFSHVIHGIIFYAVLVLAAPRLSVGRRLAIAIASEGSWEVFENTPFLIDRYRQSALAQGYFGDSVVNSVADTVAAALGFGIARVLPPWSAIMLLIGLELFTGYMVRDSLTLNIIQLVYPSAVISRWQIGA